MQRKGIVIFMDNQLLQIQNRTCRIYGTASAEYLLLQMVDEHDLAGMEREVEAIRRQTAHLFLPAAVQVENWNDDLWKENNKVTILIDADGCPGIRLHGWRRLCRASVGSIL